jgi:hypothetical protein
LWLAASGAWTLLVLCFTNCSHTSPYQAVVSAPVVDLPVPTLRLILLGDAGLAVEDSQVLRAAGDLARQPAERTVAVYLGDNVYPSGLPPHGDSYRGHAEATLLAQVRAFDAAAAQVYFTPGNHDWAEGAEIGLDNLLRQRDFIAQHGQGRALLVPGDGTPGPVCLDEAGVRLVFVDTQWWLHEGKRGAGSVPDVQQKLGECLRHSPALLFTHHPAQSHGVHGNFFTWEDHLFPLTRLHAWAYLPLPVVGSLYPFVRSFGVSPQDMAEESNVRMVRDLGSALETAPPLVWAAGHEHNLQVLDGGKHSSVALVSGSASKAHPVTDEADTIYAHEALGFMEILFFNDREPLLIVHSDSGSGVVPTFRYVLSGR